MKEKPFNQTLDEAQSCVMNERGLETCQEYNNSEERVSSTISKLYIFIYTYVLPVAMITRRY